MAARTVTGFTNYIEMADLLPRQPILETGPDNILNDQQFCLEIEELLGCDCWETDDTVRRTISATYVTLGTIRIRGRDICGLAASENGAFYVKAFATLGSNFSVAMNRGAGDVGLAVTADVGSKIWRGPVTFSLLSGDDDIMTVEVKAKRDSGAGSVYIAGVAIFSGS